MIVAQIVQTQSGRRFAVGCQPSQNLIDSFMVEWSDADGQFKKAETGNTAGSMTWPGFCPAAPTRIIKVLGEDVIIVTEREAFEFQFVGNPLVYQCRKFNEMGA